MRRWFLTLLFIAVFTIVASPLAAQDSVSPRERIAALEARLADTAGRARLEILVRLTEVVDPAKILAYREEAVRLLAAHPDLHLEMRLKTALLHAYALRRELSAAREMGTQAEELARRLGDAKKLGFVLRRLGDVERYASRFESALAFYTAAIPFSEEAGDLVNLGKLYNNSAIVYGSLGRDAERLSTYLRAREVYHAAGNLSGVGATSVNIGHLYHHQDDATAMHYYEEALRIAEQGGFEVLWGDALDNIGLLHLQHGRPRRALEAMSEALEHYQRGNKQQRVAKIRGSLAEVHLHLGELGQAAAQGRRAVELATEIDDLTVLLESWQTLAQIERERGERLSAIRFLEKAASRARDAGYAQKLRAIHFGLAELYAEEGRYAEAYSAFREHEALKSRFTDEESQRALAEMQAELDLERREKEIELLRSEQALQATELRRQSDLRRGLVAGFGLVLCVLGLAFNRYRLKTRETRLRESMAQAEAVNARLLEIDRLKDEMLANTSHELRTPLYGMLGLAESVLERHPELASTSREDLTAIVHSGRRLGTLVDDIVDFSKLRGEGLELRLGRVELYSLVDVVLTLSRTLAVEKGLELRNAVASDLPVVRADPARVQQVLHNLVGNALKFTAVGSVEVSAEALGEDRDEIEVRVRDTGIGIAEEAQEQIFDSFVQADTSTERIYGGAGLGLAISRQLVELHGGRIRVESAPGEGALFAFTLAIAPEAEREESTQSLPVPVVRGAEEGVQKIGTGSAGGAFPLEQGEALAELPADAPTILAVDDEPLVLRVLESQLRAEGYRMLRAADGPSALAGLESASVDLVLLDVMMPRMSGYEVCRKIRESRMQEELPVLFLSAKNQEGDRVAGFEVGGSDYLTKPIARLELQARVGAHLALVQAHRAQAEEVKTLRGLLPTCTACKKIRDEDGEWHQLEVYITERSEAAFSHGICPVCVAERFPHVKVSEEPDTD